MIAGSFKIRWSGLLCLTMVAAGCSDCGKGPEPENAEIQFVADKTALENAFNNTFDFEVRLDASNTQEVTVEYKTESFTDGLDCLSAVPGEDFLQQEGQLVFAPGEIKKTISIYLLLLI